jgi:hypothetical protein
MVAQTTVRQAREAAGLLDLMEQVALEAQTLQHYLALDEAVVAQTVAALAHPRRQQQEQA